MLYAFVIVLPVVHVHLYRPPFKNYQNFYFPLFPSFLSSSFLPLVEMQIDQKTKPRNILGTIKSRGIPVNTLETDPGCTHYPRFPPRLPMDSIANATRAERNKNNMRYRYLHLAESANGWGNASMYTGALFPSYFRCTVSILSGTVRIPVSLQFGSRCLVDRFCIWKE